MRRIGMTIAIGALLAVAGAGGARAAEPAKGTVSPADVRTEWTGTVEGPHSLPVDVLHGETGGTHGTCLEPQCDSYALTVSGNGGARPLVIDAEATSGSSNLMLEVVLPDGSTAFVGGTLDENIATSRRIRIPAAPDGSYTVRVGGEATQGSDYVMHYEAAATLGEPPTTACRALRTFDYESGGTPLSGAVTNDPLYGKAFGHPQMRVPSAWERGARGKGTVIAIVDSGVDLNHPDLRKNLVPGVDMVEGKDGDCAPGPVDLIGHGTMVAGFAAAEAGNRIGIAGVAPRAKIMPIRVCATTSCDNDAIAAGIRWAADQGADVINLSLGIDESMQIKNGTVPVGTLEFLADDVAYAVGRGAVVISVAMNNSWVLCGHPAADPGAVCVAAVDKRGLPTSYSNLPTDDDGDVVAFRAFGGSSTKVPGTACEEYAISTAWPGKPGNCGLAYQGGQGTSFAAPHVAGAAAILASYGLKNTEIVERLKATASNRGEYDPIMGYGIPDLEAATDGLKVRPDRPRSEPPPAPPAGPSPGVQPEAPGAQQSQRRPTRTASARCRRARAAARRSIRAAVRAREAGRTRALKRRLQARDRAQAEVHRHCR